MPHRARCAFPSLRQGLACDRRSGDIWDGSRGSMAAAVCARADRSDNWLGGIAGVWTEGEFRQDDEAVARRPCGAQWIVRYPDGTRRLHCQSGGAFLDVFNGPGTYDVERMLAGWYAPLEVEGGGEPGLKPYPCCGSAHSSINRMVHLARTHDLTPERVETIEIMPHPRRLPHTYNPDPRTPLAAKFSIQYVVARTHRCNRVPRWW